MKTSVFFMVLASLAANAATAQQVMDDSAKALDAKLTKAIFAALISETRDPFSAQIVDLKIAKGRPELVCGMINLKNSLGAYTGFQPFGFNSQYNNLLMDQNLSDCQQ